MQLSINKVKKNNNNKIKKKKIYIYIITYKFTDICHKNVLIKT